MEQEFSSAVLVRDAGGGLGGSEPLNGQVADEGESDLAGVEDANALIEFGFAEDGDAEEVAGSDEEALGLGSGGSSVDCWESRQWGK
jgi:hypothetical protein